MPIVQISKMQHRVGDLADLPQLDIGELGFATDQNRLFIGNDPLQHPVTGGDVTNTEILTSDPNCTISYSQLTGNLSLNVSNIKITGGSTGRVLQTDGAGNLSWVTVAGAGSGAPGGADGQIQYNSTGAFTGIGNLTFNDTTMTLTVDNIITGGNIGAAGNISGNYFKGNGSALANVTGANVTGQVGNALIAGTVYTNAQPNITSTGTLSNLTVTGNVAGGLFIGDGGLLSNIHANNISGQTGNAVVAGTVYTNAQPNITSVGTLTHLSVTGNISGNVISGNGSGLTSLAGANVTGQVGNSLLSGTVYTNAQPNITSVGTLSNLTVSGNVTASYVAGNGNQLFSINGANVIGQVGNANIANVANMATTVVSGAQPNITSTGILTSLKVSGNITSAPGSFFIGDGSHITNALPRRSNITVQTANISNGSPTNATLTGFKGYMLYSIQTDYPAWVTIYSSVATRGLDANRTIATDPTPGSGVIAEVITANNNPVLFTPAIVGFSTENPPDGNIQIKVNNLSGNTRPINVTMTILGIED